MHVLDHDTKKPGCGDEILDYFRAHPEAGVKSPRDIAVVGDRLLTDMFLANMMGSWGVWVNEGVIGSEEKGLVSLLILSRVPQGFMFSFWGLRVGIMTLGILDRRKRVR